MQRCVFLLNPFSARQWRRRYDLLISFIVWVIVGLACSPFILMRSSTTNLSAGTRAVYNMSSPLEETSTQKLLSYTRLYMPLPSLSPSGFRPVFTPSSTTAGCFRDLPMRRLSVPLAVTMMTLAELFGFVIPLVCISYSSFRIVHSLGQSQDHQYSKALNLSAPCRLQSLSSNSDSYCEKQTNAEKQRALKMVLSCSMLFLVCFAPYHINFVLYLMVSQGILSHCATQLAVRQFHPVSLCLANLSCCLNPLLYYFLTSEFRLHFTRHTSFSSSLLLSPVSSPTQRPTQHQLVIMESSCSDRE